MRQVHRAGEKLFIDYAGPTIGLTDGSGARIFVSAVGVFSYTYATRDDKGLAGVDRACTGLRWRRTAADRTGQCRGHDRRR
jgi:hypothetical protein